MTTAAIVPQSAAAKLIAALPNDAVKAEAEALAWEIFQTTDTDLYHATIEAVGSIWDVLEYSLAWDAMAVPPLEVEGLPTEPEPAHPAEAALPVPTAAERNAANKAAYHRAQGVELVYSRGAWLVPSGSRGGVIHRVDGAQCSCEAGQNAHPCWHVAIVRLVESEWLMAA